MNKKIKKYLDEIAKTEKKIADLQQYLRGVQAALNLKKRKMRMISRKVWKQVDWKKFRMRKSLKTKILKKMKNK